MGASAAGHRSFGPSEVEYLGVGDDNDVQEDDVDTGYFPALGMTFLAGRRISSNRMAPTHRRLRL